MHHIFTGVFQRKEVECQRQRGEEMDTMLTERDRKLAEKEAYIVHLQTALAGDQPPPPIPQQQVSTGKDFLHCVSPRIFSPANDIFTHF